MNNRPALVHACPPTGSGVMPCCGRTPFEVVRDRMTSDPTLVTCGQPIGSCTAAAEVSVPNNSCVWPDCLSDGRQAELAAQVLAAERGEETAVGPDRRVVCGCDEAPRPDAASQSRTTPDKPPASGDTADNLPGPFQVWPLARILREVAVGSRDWTWQEEWADLDRRHEATGYLAKLEQQIRENGITMPVLIGSDGRLWDGHHRLRIAVRLGIGYVPVEITSPPVATPRNAPGLRALIAAALEECRTLIPEVQADAVLAVIDAALPDRAQAAIRALEQQVVVRDRQLAAIRALLAAPGNSRRILPGDLKAALDGAATQ